MRFKVYYLDDEAELCTIFEEIFEAPDVEVVTFVKPEALIDAVKKAPPDILFLDYRIGRTTGDAVAKTLNPSCPVFLITGDISVSTDYKFVKIFAKPCREKEIADVIEFYKSGSSA